MACCVLRNERYKWWKTKKWKKGKNGINRKTAERGDR